ncbi:MAG: formate dehydrogenase accessory sulfurtransferase FdhD [Burkholderiales bacterium]
MIAPALASHAVGGRLAPVVRWRGGERCELDDWLTEEVPVALEFNGISHAVMLATPADLEDFALGFGLSEGILGSAAELFGCEVVNSPEGITVQMEVSSRTFMALKARRRTLAGRTGCGVCGTESLDQVLRPVPLVRAGAPVRASAVARAMREMRERQVLCEATGAVHAAAWCAVDGAVLVVREDVGRHNALDKLIGAVARTPIDGGFIAVTSRASVEMVQKAATAGASLLAAVSAPTLLAVRTAQAARMSLIGLARRDDLVVYAHAERVILDIVKV